MFPPVYYNTSGEVYLRIVRIYLPPSLPGPLFAAIVELGEVIDDYLITSFTTVSLEVRVLAR
jgi:hypothetical protein